MRTIKERNQDLLQMKLSGVKQKDIAKEFDMSQGRVSQILKQLRKQEQFVEQLMEAWNYQNNQPTDCSIQQEEIVNQ